MLVSFNDAHVKRGLGKALERLERFYRKEGRALFYFKRSLGKTWSIKSSLNWSNDRKRTRIVGPKDCLTYLR